MPSAQRPLLISQMAAVARRRARRLHGSRLGGGAAVRRTARCQRTIPAALSRPLYGRSRVLSSGSRSLPLEEPHLGARGSPVKWVAKDGSCPGATGPDPVASPDGARPGRAASWCTAACSSSSPTCTAGRNVSATLRRAITCCRRSPVDARDADLSGSTRPRSCWRSGGRRSPPGRSGRRFNAGSSQHGHGARPRPRLGPLYVVLGEPRRHSGRRDQRRSTGARQALPRPHPHAERAPPITHGRRGRRRESARDSHRDDGRRGRELVGGPRTDVAWAGRRPLPQRRLRGTRRESSVSAKSSIPTPLPRSSTTEFEALAAGAGNARWCSGIPGTHHDDRHRDATLAAGHTAGGKPRSPARDPSYP